MILAGVWAQFMVFIRCRVRRRHAIIHTERNQCDVTSPDDKDVGVMNVIPHV